MVPFRRPVAWNWTTDTVPFRRLVASNWTMDMAPFHHRMQIRLYQTLHMPTVVGDVFLNVV